jgi:mycothiol synthase
MRLRPPTQSDDEAVLALVVARDVADFGVPDYTLEDLRDEWRASDFDLSVDAVVAETEDGRLIGYAICHRPGTLALVAPYAEGQGVGAQLLQWSERHDCERGLQRHRQWVAHSNASARELLTAAGYQYMRSYWRMTRDLTGPVPDKPRTPFALRALDVERDVVALHELDAASFSANADYRPESLTAFREEHLEAHDLAPELSLVAEDRGQIVGFMLADRWVDEQSGYVDLLAVHPDHQRRGLGSAMLLTAFGLFAAAGLREAQLGVASDNPRALRLYERIGMTQRFQADTYERAVMGR